MKIILLQPVTGLGATGDTVTVKDGYARNYLIPNKLALPATANSARQVEHQKRLIESRLVQEKKRAEEEAQKLASISCTVERHVGEDDKLFGSVTNRDIAQALAAEGFIVDHSRILLEEPIKFLGVYHVPVHLHQDVETKVKVWVVAK
jgi:large subunit ribosomal protein L9